MRLRSEMSSEMSLLAEGLPAQVARKRPLAAVDAQVALEVSRLRVRLVALGARVARAPLVCPAVAREVVAQREGLAAPHEVAHEPARGLVLHDDAGRCCWGRGWSRTFVVA